jgi:hypothetical protein
MSSHTKSFGFLISIIAASSLLVATASARAEGPVKLVLSSHIGGEVDKTTKGDVCTVVSRDECQPGSSGGSASSFDFPESVASAPSGNIYVGDQANHRVQEFTDTGEFVLMFGEEVNATTKGDVCTEEEIKNTGANCKPGLAGTVADALSQPEGLTVDPKTKDVYVLDYENFRINEYTSGGQFLLMIGKEVNETEDQMSGSSEAERNLCTAVSKDTCKAGAERGVNSNERGAFAFADKAGDLLAVSGGTEPENVLYVADEDRVQEFSPEGKWVGEIKLPAATVASKPGSHITAIAVDNAGTDAFIVYGEEGLVRELNILTGEEVKSFEISGPEGHEVAVRSIAIDQSGRLAVAAGELIGSSVEPFGELFEASAGRLLTRFAISESVEQGYVGIGFGGKGELYAVAQADHEIRSYAPVPVAEILTGAATCVVGGEIASSATFDCQLNGEVDPYGVEKTDVWFNWGRTCALGSMTPEQPIETVETLLPVSSMLEGLRPNESFCYQLSGDDENISMAEALTGNKESVATPVVAPKLVGEPSASFVGSSSAVLYGQLNPENANTEYYFEYAPESAGGETLSACKEGIKAGCPGVASTTVLRSALYGQTGATLEVSGLQPATTYEYRLAAINDVGEHAPSNSIARFTTLAAPEVRAESLSVSDVTSTGAVVAGAVDPDGQSAIYTFELGVDEGAGTQYATVTSGATGAGTVFEPESVALTGLMPATTYAYRIAIHSGYGTAYGAPMTFTTAGLPVLISVPSAAPLLPVPSIVVPGSAPKCKKGYGLNKQRHCAKIKTKKPKRGKSKKTSKKK